MIFERLCAWFRFVFPVRRLSPLTENRVIGDAGEVAAARFLEKSGHRVLVRNWRHGRDELDLVTTVMSAAGREVLVFVEVKTRAESDLKGGYFAVDMRKRRALRRAVRAYLKSIRLPDVAWRFDIVEVRRHENGEFTAIHHCAVPLSTG